MTPRISSCIETIEKTRRSIEPNFLNSWAIVHDAWLHLGHRQDDKSRPAEGAVSLLRPDHARDLLQEHEHELRPEEAFGPPYDDAEDQRIARRALGPRHTGHGDDRRGSEAAVASRRDEHLLSKWMHSCSRAFSTMSFPSSATRISSQFIRSRVVCFIDPFGMRVVSIR